MEQIKRFMEKVQTDKGLQAAMKELAQRKAGLDEVIALAEGHGFAFTKEDWEAATKEAAQTGELSEEQLATVSGGGGWLEWFICSNLLLGSLCIVSLAFRDDGGCPIDI